MFLVPLPSHQRSFVITKCSWEFKKKLAFKTKSNLSIGLKLHFQVQIKLWFKAVVLN